MRLVYEAAKVIHIPIIGLGGIEARPTVAEYILAGASAVQVGTAHFVDPAGVREADRTASKSGAVILTQLKSVDYGEL